MNELSLTVLVRQTIGEMHKPRTHETQGEFAAEIRNLKIAVYAIAASVDMLWARYEALSRDD